MICSNAQITTSEASHRRSRGQDSQFLSHTTAGPESPHSSMRLQSFQSEYAWKRGSPCTPSSPRPALQLPGSKPHRSRGCLSTPGPLRHTTHRTHPRNFLMLEVKKNLRRSHDTVSERRWHRKDFHCSPSWLGRCSDASASSDASA